MRSHILAYGKTVMCWNESPTGQPKASHSNVYGMRQPNVRAFGLSLWDHSKASGSLRQRPQPNTVFHTLSQSPKKANTGPPQCTSGQCPRLSLLSRQSPSLLTHWIWVISVLGKSLFGIPWMSEYDRLKLTSYYGKFNHYGPDCTWKNEYFPFFPPTGTQCLLKLIQTISPYIQRHYLTSLNSNFWSSGTGSRRLLHRLMVRNVEMGSATAQPAGSLVL